MYCEKLIKVTNKFLNMIQDEPDIRENTGQEDNKNPTSRLGRFRFTVEPGLFLVCVALMLSDAVFTDLVLLRTCQVTFNFNVTTCNKLEAKTNDSEEIEAIVQPHASLIIMGKTVLGAFVPAIFSLFVGPWSDRNGRRLLFLVPLVGYAITYGLQAVLSVIPNLAPEYLLLSIIPSCLSGGLISLVTAGYCYITDITNEEQRAFRLSVVDGFFFFGVLVGTLLSSYAFQGAGSFGYPVVFSISAVLFIITAIYAYFFVPETVIVVENVKTNIFDCDLVKEMFFTCFKKRQFFKRAIILLTVLILGSVILTLYGEGSVTFLYTRKKFNWTLRHFTLWSSYRLVLALVGTTVGCWFLHWNKIIPDVYIAIVTFLTKALECCFLAFIPASTPSLLYLAVAISMFGGISTPVIRSILSKTVPKDEIGKVFSLTSSVEAIMPIAASPLYTLVYNQSLHILPGAFFLLSSFLFLMIIVLLVIIYFMQKQEWTQSYERMGAIND